MEPQKKRKKTVPSLLCINKPSCIVNRISCSLKIDKSYKILRYADNKISESATGSNKKHNLQYVPESNAEVSEIGGNCCHQTQNFALPGEDVCFKLFMYIKNKTNSSGQCNASVYIDVKKPREMSVLLYAAVRPTSTGPFVEKPNDTPYWNLACPSEEVNRIHLKMVDLESVDDDLWLTLDVTYVKIIKECEITMQPRTTKTHETDKESSFGSHIDCLLANPMNSDVTLKANGQEWPVHKCILSARSPVFAAMFNGHLKETTANSAEIKDVDSNAFDLMIKYIYKNELEDMANLEIELLCLADRFDLPGLKKDCEVELTKTLKFENCVSLLLAGIKFNAESLVEKGKLFISENFWHICKTEEWKQFVKEHAELSVDLTVASSQGQSWSLDRKSFDAPKRHLNPGIFCACTYKNELDDMEELDIELLCLADLCDLSDLKWSS